MAIEKVSLPVARKIAGMTQKQLADAVGVSESTVVNWEKFRSEPTISQAMKIGDVVGQRGKTINTIIEETIDTIVTTSEVACPRLTGIRSRSKSN